MHLQKQQQKKTCFFFVGARDVFFLRYRAAHAFVRVCVCSKIRVWRAFFLSHDHVPLRRGDRLHLETYIFSLPFYLFSLLMAPLRLHEVWFVALSAPRSACRHFMPSSASSHYFSDVAIWSCPWCKMRKNKNTTRTHNFLRECVKGRVFQKRQDSHQFFFVANLMSIYKQNKCSLYIFSPRYVWLYFSI